MRTEYPTLPDGVVAPTDENRTNPEVLKWSGLFPVPNIGDEVQVAMNNFGPATVLSYFSQTGWLGVVVQLASPPEWYKKQQKRDGASFEIGQFFGKEVKPTEYWTKA